MAKKISLPYTKYCYLPLGNTNKLVLPLTHQISHPTPTPPAMPTVATPAAEETLPVTVLLRLDCRGRRETHHEYYQVQVSKGADVTIEDFKPYVLEKTIEQFGSVMVKRTHLEVEQYDPLERFLLVSHSLPASKSSDFSFELWHGYGFKQVPEPKAANR